MLKRNAAIKRSWLMHKLSCYRSLQGYKRLELWITVSCLLTVSLLCGSTAAGAGSLVCPIPDADYSDKLPRSILPPLEKIRHIVYPVIGCPALVVAGEILSALVKADDGGKTRDWVMHIATHDPVVQSHTLAMVESSYDSTSGCYLLKGTIPAHAPRDIFDCIISSETANISDIQPNSVRVIKAFRESYRFVHLTDMHLGDPRIYAQGHRPENRNARPSAILEQILTELSFLDPEFILFSGDLVFGGPYSLEYALAFELLSRFSLPMFMVPGNHDGYASGDGLLRDGLEYWKQIIGPPYYSFNYGENQHFICINTYDAPVSQRNGWYFAVQRWGGAISQEQWEWLRGDVENACQEQRNTVIVAHHDPRGDIHGLGGVNNRADEDKDGYAEAPELLDMLAYQEWNDRTSGQAVVNLIEEKNEQNGSISPSGNISHVFLGHVHGDFIDWDEAGKSWWVHTTAAGSGGYSRDDFWGYRIVGVESDRIVSVNRTAPENETLPPGDRDQTNNQRWDYQSFAGNAITITTIRGANDGTATGVAQEVANYLEVSVSGVLKFYMPLIVGSDGEQANYGYEVTGGIIRDIVRSGNGGGGNQLVVYVEAEVAPGEHKRVRVEPSED